LGHGRALLSSFFPRDFFFPSCSLMIPPRLWGCDSPPFLRRSDRCSLPVLRRANTLRVVTTVPPPFAAGFIPVLLRNFPLFLVPHPSLFISSVWFRGRHSHFPPFPPPKTRGGVWGGVVAMFFFHTYPCPRPLRLRFSLSCRERSFHLRLASSGFLART